VCLAEKQQIPIFIIPISIILGLSIVEIVIIGNKYDIVMFAYKEVNNICGVSIIIDFIKIKNWWIEVNDRFVGNHFTSMI
jgi:hypothetical protein